MKRFLGLVILVICLAGFLGFSAGYRYAVRCSPNLYEFWVAEKFMTFVDEEVSAYQRSNSWGWNIKTTFNGPALKICVHDNSSLSAKDKFKQKIMIRKDIIDNVEFRDDVGRMDMEKFRPLAKEIAKKIIEAQPNTD